MLVGDRHFPSTDNLFGSSKDATSKDTTSKSNAKKEGSSSPSSFTDPISFVTFGYLNVRDISNSIQSIFGTNPES